jgi:hypothetical protein
MDIAAFEEKIERIPEGGCWVWMGGIRNSCGYGAVHLGKNVYDTAHRLAYKLYVGPIPEGKAVLHDCDNPICCNPHHLRAGTWKENRADTVKRGRAKWNLAALQKGRLSKKWFDSRGKN